MFKEILFKYDINNAKYIKLTNFVLFRVYLKIFIFGLTIGFLSSILISKEAKHLYENVPIIITSLKEDDVDHEKLYNYLLETKIQFPEIVFAQAILETGHFKSKIFITNKNLFGMKEAKQRPTTAKGTELEHAFYENWKESVKDYAMFQSRYILPKIKTEKEYLMYLKSNYAEDPNYIQKIKQIKDSLELKKK
jgi:hypothetical protein